MMLCLTNGITGLESMTGSDAPKIITLFKGMAVYAEDQIIAVTLAF